MKSLIIIGFGAVLLLFFYKELFLEKNRSENFKKNMEQLKAEIKNSGQLKKNLKPTPRDILILVGLIMFILVSILL